MAENLSTRFSAEFRDSPEPAYSPSAIAASQHPSIHQLQRAQDLARARVRLSADLSHRLGDWHPDPLRPGVERVACRRCGCGGDLHLGTATEGINDALVQPCRGGR